MCHFSIKPFKDLLVQSFWLIFAWNYRCGCRLSYVVRLALIFFSFPFFSFFSHRAGRSGQQLVEARVLWPPPALCKKKIEKKKKRKINRNLKRKITKIIYVDTSHAIWHIEQLACTLAVFDENWLEGLNWLIVKRFKT